MRNFRIRLHSPRDKSIFSLHAGHMAGGPETNQIISSTGWNGGKWANTIGGCGYLTHGRQELGV